MINYIYILDTIFEGVLYYIFCQAILKKKSILPYYWTILIYIGCDIIYGFITSNLLGNTSLPATVIRSLLAILSRFVLMFLFQTNIKTKLFVAMSYIILTALAEEFSFLLISLVNSFNFNGNNLDIMIFHSISLITNLFVFVITMIIYIFKNKNTEIRSTIYTIFLLIIPTCSLCLVISKPFFNLNTYMPITYFILISFLLFINMLNYILLQNVLHTEELQSTVKILSTQVEYQKNKYLQLGESYKNIQSFMHDTKKHLFYIENCVKEEKYDEIIPYSRNTMQDLESRYCTINTGNLVIDSFVSNLLLQTKRHEITLHTNLKVDVKKIPVNDYHMTIILGNLLDNALNASLQQNKGEINVTIQTIEDTFTIHITNTCNSAEIKTSPKDIDSIDFIHGYGLLNVKKTIAQYDGICVIQCENNIYSVTTIIPL